MIDATTATATATAKTKSKPIHKYKRSENNKVGAYALYSKSLLTRKVVLPITCVGSSLDGVIDKYIKDHYEGKCIVEGYVKPESTRIMRYSSGTIDRGCNVIFETVFECDICFPVEGMLIQCVVKNKVKAGLRAESIYQPSPIVVFIAKDHHFTSEEFNNVEIDAQITVKVIGQRFELNDTRISIIGELVKDRHKDRDRFMPHKKPRYE